MLGVGWLKSIEKKPSGKNRIRVDCRILRGIAVVVYSGPKGFSTESTVDRLERG